MRLKRTNPDEIIIKRRTKKHKQEQHGGAWKVAFADFTLAMMALFMVLWIIQPQKIAPTTSADALLNPLLTGGAGIFDGISDSPIELEGTKHQQRKKNEIDPKTLSEIEKKIAENHKISLEELSILMHTLAQQLDAEANLLIDVVPQGLRILIKDDENRYMFERGSAKLHPNFVPILARLATTLNNVDNNIIISGHTDATQYSKNSLYNNWNLSGDRALMARNILVKDGLVESKVLQVTAQADTTPINEDNPEDGSNRRIELLVLTQQAESLYRQLFSKDNIPGA
ncbi:MAG: OmpA family protein [Cellvibrio sp.]